MGARWDRLAVIALGGALGSGARYGVAEAMPHAPGTVPWSTVTVNVSGGFLLGLIMVFLLDEWSPRRYVRPFLGVGFLGGYTTFSTYMLDTLALLEPGQRATAVLYLLGSLVVGLGAVWAGMVAARVLVRLARRSRRDTEEPTGSDTDTTIARRTS